MQTCKPVLRVLAVVLVFACVAIAADARTGHTAKSASTVPPKHVVFSLPGRFDIRPGIDPNDLSTKRNDALRHSRWSEKHAPGGGFFFSQAVNYQGGASSVFLADVNGDGHLDVVETNGSVGVLLGNGDGTLQPPIYYTLGEPGADSVYVVDVNGDGLPDIVVANQGGGNNGGGSVSVLLNGANGVPGTFQPAVTYDSGSGGSSADSVFVVDMNGDGFPDIVVANQGGGSNGDGSVSVLFGVGDGTFQPAVTYDSGGVQATSVAVADVNGDGFPDILVGNNCFGLNNCPNQQGGAAVLLNNGSGVFTLTNNYQTGGPTTSIVVGDVNDDGIPDLVVGCASYGGGFLLGVGDGSFGAFQGAAGVIGQVVSVAVKDVNGDGINDLLFGLGYCPQCDNGNDSGVTVLLGSGNGNFQQPLTYDSGGVLAYGIGLGDLNGDGTPDLVAVNACDSGNIDNSCGGNTAVFLNSVNGLTTTLSASPNPALRNQMAMYTATVTEPGGGSPTGNVTFRDGRTVIATVPVTSNQAVYSTKYGTPGAHPITANYSLNQVNQLSSIVIEFVLGTPTATTLAASSVTAIGAVLNGRINPAGARGPVSFFWGLDPSLTTYNIASAGAVTQSYTTQSFNAPITFLASNTTYYFQIVFQSPDDGGFSQYGAIHSFTTKNPVVTTQAATSVTAVGAVLNGEINPLGGSGTAQFYWGTDPTLTTHNVASAGTVNQNSNTQPFNSPITFLASNTTYYFQMVFQDNTNTSPPQLGAIKSFTTKSPMVTTQAANSITAIGAVLNGEINPLGGSGTAQFYWGTDPTLSTYNVASAGTVTQNSNTQPFNGQLTSLASNTTYYFQMVFQDTYNASAPQLAAIRSFTTKNPVVGTLAATSVTAVGAVLNGEINPLGGDGPAEFYWGTDPTLTTYSIASAGTVTQNSNTQPFNGQLTSLASNTTYYFQMVFLDYANTSPPQLGPIKSLTTK
jgi:VCBS repeat protein/Big-like domain-containing protein